jgi:hypothetical protein
LIENEPGLKWRADTIATPVLPGPQHPVSGDELMLVAYNMGYAFQGQPTFWLG